MTQLAPDKARALSDFNCAQRKLCAVLDEYGYEHVSKRLVKAQAEAKKAMDEIRKALR